MLTGPFCLLSKPRRPRWAGAMSNAAKLALFWQHAAAHGKKKAGRPMGSPLCYAVASGYTSLFIDIRNSSLVAVRIRRSRMNSMASTEFMSER